jgi:hypothetical protein
MTLLIPAGFAHVAFKFQFLEGQEPAICTMGMDLNGYAGTFNAGLDATTQAWQDHIIPGQSNVLTYLGTTAQYNNALGPATVDTPRNVNGGEAGAMLTRNTALLCRKTSIRGGRRGRGRMYVPATLRELDVDQAGNITVAQRNALQGAFDSFFNALNALGNGPCILHNDQTVVSYSSVTGKPVYGTVDPGPPDNVTALIVDARAATQRRRMRN